MLKSARVWTLIFSILLLGLPSCLHLYAQQDAGTVEVRFAADTQDERDAGVWIDGKYVGYVKELKGDRKVTLAPGEHDILIKQAGYKDFTQKLVVTPSRLRRSAWRSRKIRN